MTDHSIKLTLLNALLLCCLQGILAGAVLADAVILQQEGAPAGKRKSLHEYGPEDVHPEAQENENSAPKQRQTPQPKARNVTPLAPRSKDSTGVMAPALTPMAPRSKDSTGVTAPALTPTPTPVPTVTPAPARVGSSVPATAITRSAPQKVKNSEAYRRKLLVNSSVFLLLLMALVFFAIKMWGQLRANARTESGEVSQELLSGPDRRQLRIVGPDEGATEKRVNHSDANPKRLKTKAQNGRRARFKKA